MNEHTRPVLVNRHCVDQLAEIRKTMRQLKNDEADLVREISAMMGDADSLGGDEYIAHQTVTTRKGAIDAEALEAAGIDVDAYRKPDVTVYAIRVERRAAEAV